MRLFTLRFVNLFQGARNTIPRESENTDISNHRIDALVDAFFAIALTLLVLDIKTFHVDSDRELTQHLILLIPKFFTYFLSFAILGLLWFEHQMVSHYVLRSDRTHIWLNLLFLMSISMIPFSASLLGENIQHPSATTFYGTNLLIVGVIQYLDWEYITRKNRLIDENLDRRLVRAVQKIFLFVPLTYAIAIEVSFFSISLSLALYSLGTFVGALRMNAIFYQSH
ncbi:MAG: hypothetical protein DCF19_15430 [Pseudanabaena frigida]|uniref:DUF1211 domain-containing protein n=1 Tax=Pseudanabaena frigida TaxID=945775 RepID=A0A2W4W184_9CYAN|nr:MAG: hypothetical protein DCF19_15430 [Pseudanabaena frigida]